MLDFVLERNAGGGRLTLSRQGKMWFDLVGRCVLEGEKTRS